MTGEIRASDLHRESMKNDPAYRKAFAEQEEEFARATAAIDRAVRPKKETKP
jgi:hypothetical protein